MKKQVLPDNVAVTSTEIVRDAHQYKMLIKRVVDGWDRGNTEMHEIVEQVWQQRVHEPCVLTDDERIELARDVVHQCVVRQSYRIFNQSGRFVSDHTDRTFAGFSVSERLQNMPVTFKVVYLLFETGGFRVYEIAAILNITVVQVNERLHRALLMLESHKRSW